MKTLLDKTVATQYLEGKIGRPYAIDYKKDSCGIYCYLKAYKVGTALHILELAYDSAGEVWWELGVIDY